MKQNPILHVTASLLMLSAVASAQEAAAGDAAAELAKKLSNPVAALISVPFQNNYDWGGGPEGEGSRYLLNFQPVVPISINDCWNLISRTIIPYIDQQDTYDWDHSQLTLPINAQVSQLVKLGGMPVQFSLGGRYYAEGPENAPDWGIRFAVTFLFPK